jgi:hypothetical protein
LVSATTSAFAIEPNPERTAAPGVTARASVPATRNSTPASAHPSRTTQRHHVAASAAPQARRHSPSTATRQHKPASKKPHAQRRHSDASFPPDYESTPAYRYAQLDAAACLTEIAKRGIDARADTNAWPGIETPMRLASALNGVYFHTDLATSERAHSPYELFDCRLLLALHDFTKLLRAEGIDEAVLSSSYRPNPALGDEPGRRHAGGLAVDLHRFKLEEGRWIKVDQDFHGRIGAKVCGTHAPKPVPPSSEAELLRRLVCGASEQRLFQSILTPNYDPPHRNHFHLELTVGVRWFIVS